MTTYQIISRGVNRYSRRPPILRSKTPTRPLRSTTHLHRGHQIYCARSRIPFKIYITSPFSPSLVETQHLAKRHEPSLYATHYSLLHGNSLRTLPNRLCTNNTMCTIFPVSTSTPSNPTTRGIPFRFTKISYYSFTTTNSLTKSSLAYTRYGTLTNITITSKIAGPHGGTPYVIYRNRHPSANQKITRPRPNPPLPYHHVPSQRGHHTRLLSIPSVRSLRHLPLHYFRHHFSNIIILHRNHTSTSSPITRTRPNFLYQVNHTTTKTFRIQGTSRRHPLQRRLRPRQHPTSHRLRPLYSSNPSNLSQRPTTRHRNNLMTTRHTNTNGVLTSIHPRQLRVEGTKRRRGLTQHRVSTIQRATMRPPRHDSQRRHRPYYHLLYPLPTLSIHSILLFRIHRLPKVFFTDVHHTKYSCGVIPRRLAFKYGLSALGGLHTRITRQRAH